MVDDLGIQAGQIRTPPPPQYLAKYALFKVLIGALTYETVCVWGGKGPKDIIIFWINQSFSYINSSLHSNTKHIWVDYTKI